MRCTDCGRALLSGHNKLCASSGGWDDKYSRDNNQNNTEANRRTPHWLTNCLLYSARRNSAGKNIHGTDWRISYIYMCFYQQNSNIYIVLLPYDIESHTVCGSTRKSRASVNWQPARLNAASSPCNQSSKPKHTHAGAPTHVHHRTIVENNNNNSHVNFKHTHIDDSFRSSMEMQTDPIRCQRTHTSHPFSQEKLYRTFMRRQSLIFRQHIARRVFRTAACRCAWVVVCINNSTYKPRVCFQS